MNESRKIELSAAEENALSFLRSLLAARGRPADFSMDENLFLSGKLDSLAFAQIAVYLERNCGLDLSHVTFDATTFESARKILGYCR